MIHDPDMFQKLYQSAPYDKIHLKVRICLVMNWTYTLQQLEDIQTANRIQRENGSEDIGYAWDNTEDDGDGEKLKNLTTKKMLQFIQQLNVLTQEKTYL